MNEPKISVIIPVYNGERYLHKCLQSLIGQSFFANMELLLVDDGSCDGSGAVMDAYAKQYPQIQVFHIPNGGVSNARNLGLQHARGKYITFVDVDDWVDPNCYQDMYARAEGGNADLVAAGLFIDEGDKILLTLGLEDGCCSGETVAEKFLSGELDVHVYNKLFKRKIACSVQFDSKIRIAEDRLYLFECLLQVQHAELMGQCYYHYFQNDASVMNQSFSPKHFDDVFVGERIVALTQETYPNLLPYAQCMNINALCRILGDISMTAGAKDRYRQEYSRLWKQVRQFSLAKSMQYASKKHWISLLIAKVSPKLYGQLRSNKRLKYIKT